MAQQNLIDIFEDCLSRRAAGESIDDCLRIYPAYSQRLRPLLEAGEAIRSLRPTNAELLEDQALVWRQIEAQLPMRMASRRRGSRMILQLLAAVLVLLALMAATWFVLTRPDVPDLENIIVPIINTGTPTATVTVTSSQTPTQTVTPTPTAIVPTVAATETGMARPRVTLNPPRFVTAPASESPVSTATLPPPTLAPQTIIPTATFAPGCDAPLSEADARARVLAIYPGTAITSIQQLTKFGGTLVWEVRTSHGIEVNVDVACGTILTIERQETSSGSGTSNDTDNSASGSSGTSGSNDNGNGGSGGSGNDNSGSGSGNDNDSSGPGSDGNDNEDDNSGMGSGDDDDNSGMGSGDD